MTRGVEMSVDERAMALALYRLSRNTANGQFWTVFDHFLDSFWLPTVLQPLQRVPFCIETVRFGPFLTTFRRRASRGQSIQNGLNP